MDAVLRQQKQQHIKDELERVEKEMAWEREKCGLGFKKMYSR